MQAVSKIFVIAGPSGSGKSTLLKRLCKEYPDTFGFSVSHTTRKPRPGEIDGKDYHFVEKKDMLKQLEAGDFIENATFSGNMYGTSVKAVCDVVEAGRVCMLDIDMQGVKSVKKTDLKSKYIFIQPPSFEVLEKRLRNRGTENEESILARLAASKKEMEFSSLPGSYDNIIINDDLEQAYQSLKGAIFVIKSSVDGYKDK